MKKVKKKNPRPLHIDTLIGQLSIINAPSDGQKDLGLSPGCLKRVADEISVSLVQALRHCSTTPSNGGGIADLVGNTEGLGSRQCLCDCTVVVNVLEHKKERL